MKRPPKMYRKKRGGRLVGSWRVMIDGKEVNLGTSDAEKARQQLQRAMKHGARHFDDELEGAAALEGTAEQAETLNPTGFNGSPEKPGGDAPPASPPAPPSPPPPPPDAPPAPAQDAGAGDEAEVMAAAAADVAGEAANDNGAPELQIDNEVLAAMLEQGGAVIVDLQLALQAYAIKRGTGLVAGAIPADSQLRTGAAKAWVQQLKVWFPSSTQLPPWAMALILPAMCLPAQLANARKPTPEELEAEKKKKEHADPPVAAAQ